MLVPANELPIGTFNGAEPVPLELHLGARLGVGLKFCRSNWPCNARVKGTIRVRRLVTVRLDPNRTTRHPRNTRGILYWQLVIDER